MHQELSALYHIHRNQILLNAKDSDDGYRFPPSYLYAIANHIYPALHDEWCTGDDPYTDLYEVSNAMFDKVTDYIDSFLAEDKEVPTYYQLESALGTRENRYHVNRILRYCYLDERYPQGVFAALLKGDDHPGEAKSITRSLTEDDLLLI